MKSANDQPVNCANRNRNCCCRMIWQWMLEAGMVRVGILNYDDDIEDGLKANDRRIIPSYRLSINGDKTDAWWKTSMAWRSGVWCHFWHADNKRVDCFMVNDYGMNAMVTSGWRWRNGNGMLTCQWKSLMLWIMFICLLNMMESMTANHWTWFLPVVSINRISDYWNHS